MRSTLERQLRLKFGELSPSAVAQIDTAPTEELELWTERVLTANSLDEVVGEGD